MFSLRQLKAFITVAENRSFTKAAKILYMTQPAISAQIKALETRLDIQLLERNDKNIVLTEAGQLFFEEACKIIALHENFFEMINELKGIRRGKLTLAASTIPGEYILPAALGEFTGLYPGLDISLKIADTGMVVDLLLKRLADLGMIGAPVKNDTIHLEEFVKDELIIIKSEAGNPGDISPGMKPVEEISPEQLLASPFVLREADSGTRMVFFNKLKEKGINPKDLRIVMELGSTRAIITAVENGIGLSVVSRLAAADALQLGKIREVKVSGMTFERSLYLAWNKNKSQSYGIKAFLKHLKERYSTDGENL